MSKKVIIESNVSPDSIDALMSFLDANLANVRGFSGCLHVTVYFDQKNHKMIFDEEWQSIEHHQNYIRSITDSGVLEERGAFLESPPDINYFDRIEL